MRPCCGFGRVESGDDTGLRQLEILNVSLDSFSIVYAVPVCTLHPKVSIKICREEMEGDYRPVRREGEERTNINSLITF